jgi:hypothetical protein
MGIKKIRVEAEFFNPKALPLFIEINACSGRATPGLVSIV